MAACKRRRRDAVLASAYVYLLAVKAKGHCKGGGCVAGAGGDLIDRLRRLHANEMRSIAIPGSLPVCARAGQGCGTHINRDRTSWMIIGILVVGLAIDLIENSPVVGVAANVVLPGHGIGDRGQCGYRQAEIVASLRRRII